MRRNRWKKILAAVLCAAMISPVTVVSAEEAVFVQSSQSEEFSVSLEEEYPELGKELHVRVSGLEEGESCSYTWKVDGTVVGQGESYRPGTGDLEKFISVTVTTSAGKSKEHSVYFSKLPVVYIDTNNVPIVDKENYIPGHMKIQGNGRFNSSNTTLYDGEMEMRGRGNSSWEAPKKPYRLKLGSKADLLGMGASKHWTLLANYYDASLSRNKLSFDFSGELGLAYMESENVILILNNQYQGVYQLCEHIRIDKTRVNITDWEKAAEDAAEAIADANPALDGGDLEDFMVENMSWATSGEVVFEGNTYKLSEYDVELPDIDGGYLLELDKNLDEVSSFYTKNNQPLMFKSPEYVKTNSDMMAFVQGYINAFEQAIAAPDGYTVYKGEEVHYSQLYDMDALAAYFLVTELFFNIDGMKKSTYMYKDNGEAMKMGPIWDMDWCADGPYDQNVEERWQVLFYDDDTVKEQWYRWIIGDPYFAYRVKKLYDEYHDSIDEMVAEGGRIDENIEYLKEAGSKNDTKWSSQITDFLPDSQNLKNWMKRRISWLDEQTKTVDSLLASWGEFDANQENGEVLRIGQITTEENGIRIQVQTSSTEAVGFYINGLKYGEENAADNAAELLIPYERLSAEAKDEIFVAVRTKNQGVVCTDYRSVQVQTPEVTQTPVPTETEAPQPTETEAPQPTETEAPQPTETEAPVPTETEEPQPTETEAPQPTETEAPQPTETEAPQPTETEVPTPTEEVTPTGTPEVKENVTTVFDDVYEDWYTEYVQYVYDNHLMTGIKGTKHFAPDNNITKAQIAQVLYNMEGQPKVTDLRVFDELKDVYEAEWYANAVAWAYSTGVVTGDLNSKEFSPNADVTREQLALMMFRYAKFKKYDVTAASDFEGLVNADKVADWSYEGMSWAVGAGLISGAEKDGVKDLAPQGNASRAQMAAILKRFCEGYGL